MQRIVFSGFGGQGVLTLGQFVATLAMKNGKYVTWMPSYGAEMRGGTANCTVIVSDSTIGSPIANCIDILVAMNEPSIEKFANQMEIKSHVFINSSMVKKPELNESINIIEIDATAIAANLGNTKVANMVMLAGFLQTTNFFTMQDVINMLEQKFGKKYPHLIPINIKAIEQGMKVYN